MKKSIQYFLFVLMIMSVSFAQVMEEWKTHYERSNYLETANYVESMKYFQKLADYSPYAEFKSIGVSPQGRDIYVLIVSKDKTFDVHSARETGKPVILVENGIHSGEIEGKDACAILLREILVTKEKESLIENVNLLVIPIFSVDSHERCSPYNRINQNGPTNMGWRTTSTNHNLNRDFVKADTPEMQVWLKFYNEWLPDFFIDSHTTDGLDTQYTITYMIEKFGNVPPMIGKWSVDEYVPYVQKRLEDNNFLMAPYLWFKDWKMENGLLDYVTPPMLSTGYVALQNRPGLLIETHSLKPYVDRVNSTKIMVEATLEIFNEQADDLVTMNKDADEWNINTYINKGEYFPLEFEYSTEVDSFLYKGIKWNEKDSWIAGTPVKEYNNKPFEITIPHFHQNVVADSIKVPYAYLIPQEWKEVIDLLDLHGIEYERINEDTKFNTTRYKFSDVEFPAMPFDGRFKPSFNIEKYNEEVGVSKGTVLVKTNQRRLPLIMYLMEPRSEDSFVKWGFFNTIFIRTEYFELYSMQPVAEEMVKKNPELKEEFLIWLGEHPEVKDKPRDRMRWFYEKSPYYDQTHNIYPVMRVEEKF